MTPEKIAELNAVAKERAPSLRPRAPELTMTDLDRRITALENHPALNPTPKLNEEPNG